MSTRTVRKLTDLEIDEVSLVDRPANQHGLVAFAKAHGEDTMTTIYDAETGVEVYEDELQHGDVVTDDAGNEFVFVEDDGSTGAYQEEFEDDGELVGKSAKGVVQSFFRGKAPEGNVRTRRELQAALKGRDAKKLYNRARTVPGQLTEAVRRGYAYGARGEELNAAAITPGGRRAVQAGARVGRNRSAYIAGGAGGTTGAGIGYGYSRRDKVGKSLGQSVYEELSKALTADDQMDVIAKMADEVEVYKSAAEQAMDRLDMLEEQAELEEYTEIAKGYGLPVDPYRLGSILKSAAATMDDEDLAELDRLLMSQGEMYDELGTSLGLSESTVHGQIEALALETVGKADVSVEEATVALYAANPAAYDEYLAESR